MKRPRASHTDAPVRIVADGVHVAGHPLPPLAALVWLDADGSRDVGDLANAAALRLGVPVTEDAVWLALDMLADAGLLEERSAPPAAGQHAWTRREMLGAAALAAVAAVVPRALAADDATAPSVEELADTARRALDEAEAARARGDSAAAAERLEAAKEANRKRTSAERDAEQHAKGERRRRFDAAPDATAPRAARDVAPRGAVGSGSAAGDAAASGTPQAEGSRPPPGPAVDDRQRHYQEQELKRTQERNLKR